MCSLWCVDHGLVHGRQARRQDLRLRELRQRVRGLPARVYRRGDAHAAPRRLSLGQAASASGAISSRDRPRVSSPSTATATAVITSRAMNTANVPFTAIAVTSTGVRYGPMIPPMRPTAAATPEPVARSDVG